MINVFEHDATPTWSGFIYQQLLQKIEIEIDDKGRTEEFLLEGYNMLIARIKEKLKPVSEELSMRLKEKKFEDY